MPGRGATRFSWFWTTTGTRPPWWTTDFMGRAAAAEMAAEDTEIATGGGFTLGDAQYHWFKRTLEQSKAKYKFVFAHHVLGTGRGGIDEWDLLNGAAETNGAIGSSVRSDPAGSCPFIN